MLGNQGDSRLLNTNAAWVAGKTVQVKDRTHEGMVDIVVVTESKLREYINKVTVFLKGFRIMRAERPEKTGGGIVLLISERYECKKAQMGTQQQVQNLRGRE
ncbi:hypothetical protein SK128_002932 [Halocaridina rubra]|uniref:Uncharacterized protein n=1 Tax=Halocaridina rubra TaxID=373956 RepID=A0AAN8WNE1_HALRR